MFSNNLKKRFIKDSGVPIPILEDEYWDYFIDLYDEHYNSKSKWESFKCVMDTRTESDLFRLTKEIEDNTIGILKEVQLQRYETQDHIFSKGNLYNPENNGKCFISIDLKKANFQAFQTNPEFKSKYDTYESLIRETTDLEYFINSKQLRQVIFGKSNPKLQINIMRHIIWDIYNGLYHMGVCAKYINNDEIIYQISDDIDIGFYDKIKNIDFGYDVKVDMFRLCKLRNYNFYLKQTTMLNEFLPEIEKYKIKSTPTMYIPQVIKYLKDVGLKHQDLMFKQDGRLAKFIEPLDFNHTSSTFKI